MTAWIVVGVIVVLLAVVLLGRRRGTPAATTAADDPHNLSPLVRAVRRRRAEQGRGDNWLTRPLVKVDLRGDGRRPVQLRPKSRDE